ncbi:hypothetical protein HNQ51_003573 [Inhella inkyongensis]|uniref:Solute-binding protein family 3/N-terminal domain-containing protein n=1 Tax=Inhella inkyongensis TaxID=392593 RepID=A0A840S9M2_9BURK|nr:ABC transporter substrate-binding protein [Inhella inkyongensis]MBB5206228.1 hypothetical protein [Inhella inkyongensis]
MSERCGRRALLAAACVPAAAWTPLWAQDAKPPTVPLFIGETSNRPVWRRTLDRLAEVAGLRWDIQVLPWGRAQLLAERGQGLIFALDRTTAREQHFEFGRSLVSTHVWVLSRQGEEFAVGGPEDLLERRVCVARAARYGDAFEALRPRMRLLTEADQRIDGLLRMLRARRCDAILLTARGDDARSAAAVLRSTGADLSGTTVLPVPVHHGGVYFAAAKGSEWLTWLPRLDAASQRLRPELEQLRRAEAERAGDPAP